MQKTTSDPTRFILMVSRGLTPLYALVEQAPKDERNRNGYLENRNDFKHGADYGKNRADKKGALGSCKLSTCAGYKSTSGLRR